MRQSISGLPVFVDGVAPDAGHNGCTGGLQGWQFMFEPVLRPQSLESDTVDHAGGGRVYTRCGIAFPRRGFHRLDHYCA